MRRRLATRIVLVAAAACASALADTAPPSPIVADPDAILGVWLTAPDRKGRAQVRVVREGDRYMGTIVWTEAPPDAPPGDALDVHNPDPAQRDRPIIGLRLLDGFRHAGKNVWTNGTIYDPSTGSVYRCKLTLADPDTLNVRGYIGISIIGRTSVWKRLADGEPPAAPPP